MSATTGFEKRAFRTSAVTLLMSLVLATLTATGCSKLNEMHDATMDMDSTTKQMNDETKTLNDKTTDLDSKTDELLKALNAMTAQMNALLNQTKDLDDKTAQLLALMSQLYEKTSELLLQTGNVATITDEVKDLTTQVVALTKSLTLTTASTYEDLRQQNAQISRQEAIKDMKNNAAVETKIKFAGIYMLGFEYQVWSGQGRDTLDERDTLFDLLFKELIPDAKSFMTNDTSKLSVDPTSTSANMLNLYAIAGALQQLNPIQTQVIASVQDQYPGIQVYSVLDLMHQTLQTNQTVEQSHESLSSLKPYEQDALLFPSEMLYMLKLRANFLPMLVLAKLAHLEYATMCTKIKTLIGGFTADIKASDLQAAEIQDYTDYMKMANDERAFLQSIGSDPNYNCKLNLLYKKMVIPSLDGLPDANAQALQALEDQINTFIQALPPTSLSSCIL